MPRPPPPSLRTRLAVFGMALVFAGLGAACAWLVADALAHGRVDARHGPVFRAREPIYFTVELTIRAAATAALLAAGGWLAWAAAFAPPGMLRPRSTPKR